jgi:uncharacterized repeat protein (TIGR04076 family)
MINKDLIDAYVSKDRGEFDLCPVYQDGQEFIIENFPSRPDGFCDWAWADIQRDVVGVMFGSHFPWMQEPGVVITCCTDGFRPVVFKVEMME